MGDKIELLDIAYCTVLYVLIVSLLPVGGDSSPSTLLFSVKATISLL